MFNPEKRKEEKQKRDEDKKKKEDDETESNESGPFMKYFIPTILVLGIAGLGVYRILKNN